MRVGQSSN